MFSATSLRQEAGLPKFLLSVYSRTASRKVCLLIGESRFAFPGRAWRATAPCRSHRGHDPVLQYMTKKQLPLVAETYIKLNWGDLPDEIDPEDQELLDALRCLEKGSLTPKATAMARLAAEQGEPLGQASTKLCGGHVRAAFRRTRGE